MDYRFAAVGDNCIDRFLPPIGLSQVGGNAVNVAVQLARRGHNAHYFGAVGNDDAGSRIRDLLAGNNVAVEHLRTRPGITAYTDIRVMPDGDREIAYEEFGTCRGYQPDEADVASLLTMNHVHIGWMDDGGALRRLLVAAGISVSQDISVNAAPGDLGVEGLAIAFASAGSDPRLAAEMAGDLIARGARHTAITLGSEGSLVFDGRDHFLAGIAPVEVIDTTGAGDSFIAGFISAYTAGKGLPACLEAGRDCAAFTCTHVGGFPQTLQPL